jgi:hypothetical protein
MFNMFVIVELIYGTQGIRDRKKRTKEQKHITFVQIKDKIICPKSY